MVNSLRKVYYLILLIIIIIALYRVWIRTGYEQAIVIEDRYWGVDKYALPPDQNSFVFRRLIPYRITLHPIYIKNRYFNFVFYYSLSPNEILGLDDSFSIKLDLVYVYDLDVNKLSDIFIRLENKDWKSIDSYIKIKLKDLLYQSIKDELKIESNLVNGEELLKSYIHNGFIKQMNQNFEQDGIYFKKVYIQDLYVPDVNQLNIILRQSDKYLEKKLERSVMIDEAKAKRISNSIMFQFEKEKLEDIAKLIRKYPEVKEYLKIEKLSEQAKFIYLPADPFWFENSYQEKINEKLLNEEKPKDLNKKNTNTSKSGNTFFVDKTPP